MEVTLSERRLTEQIKQLENLDPATTMAEISDRLPHYFGRLAQHISQNHGVTFVGKIHTQGELGTFRFALTPIFDEAGRSDRISGLQMLAPNSVTVEQGDIPGLVPNGITQTILIDEWHRYAHELQKILPHQIGDILENAARHVMTQPSSTMIGNSEFDDFMFQDFLQRSGRKDPLAKRMAREKAEQEELARRQAQRDLDYERFRNAADEW